MEIDKSPTAEDSSVSGHDRELLSAFADGDESAFETFVRKHEQRLARIAFRILGCQAAAEDARNNAFMRLISQNHSLERLAEPAAWLTRCVVNEALTRLRQDAREKRVLSGFSPPESTALHDGALETLMNAETFGELGYALSKLSPMQRTLVSLRFDEGMTFDEIAVLLNRPPSTIKSQLAKSISLLRATLSIAHKPLQHLSTQSQSYS